MYHSNGTLLLGRRCATLCLLKIQLEVVMEKERTGKNKNKMGPS